jgi:hypothetical protein
MNSFAVTTEPKLMPEPGKKYRLITRSDMDGLVCAIILKELNLVAEVIFAHPNDTARSRSTPTTSAPTRPMRKVSICASTITSARSFG